MSVADHESQMPSELASSATVPLRVPLARLLPEAPWGSEMARVKSVSRRPQ